VGSSAIAERGHIRHQRAILHSRSPDRPDGIGIPAGDIIDLDYPAWHTRNDTLDAVSARSLQTVGDVVLAALPKIEQRLRQPSVR
jgi:hypothetical protein